MIYEHKIYDITDQFEDEFNSKPNIIFLFSINEVSEFILQHGHTLELFTIDFLEDKPDDIEEQEEELHDANEEDILALN